MEKKMDNELETGIMSQSKPLISPSITKIYSLRVEGLGLGV